MSNAIKKYTAMHDGLERQRRMFVKKFALRVDQRRKDYKPRGRDKDIRQQIHDVIAGTPDTPEQVQRFRLLSISVANKRFQDEILKDIFYARIYVYPCVVSYSDVRELWEVAIERLGFPNRTRKELATLWRAILRHGYSR